MTEIILSKSEVRNLWLNAQGLSEAAFFGKGPKATPKAIKHLGYVQIDTINVIERAHHHILYSRIPDYKCSHLHQAQSKDKTVLEYWTHALAYVATDDFRYFIPAMKRRKKDPWYKSVTQADIRKVMGLIKTGGPLSIRDIEDDVLVEKTHPWASKKPSKKALEVAFNGGDLVISERLGMLKKYDLPERHFGWVKKPKSATATEILDYQIERSLRSQGVISIDSTCYLAKAQNKKDVAKRIDLKVRQGLLAPVKVQEAEKITFWMRPELLDQKSQHPDEITHILSPFDPLVIQRKRFHTFFNHDHRFEAYLPRERRQYGYFTLPVIVGDRAVAVMDLKTDRQKQKLLIQQWSWLGKHRSQTNKALIEKELSRFEKFQLAHSLS